MSSEVRKTSCLAIITDDVLKDVECSYRKEGKFTDRSLLTLHTVFGGPFERATEILEKDCVTLLTNSKGTRTVIQSDDLLEAIVLAISKRLLAFVFPNIRNFTAVHGRTGELYTIFPDINFCNCQAYQYQVLKDSSHLTCKHVLAAKLAMIMGKVRRIELPDKEIVRVLCLAAKCDDSADVTLI